MNNYSQKAMAIVLAAIIPVMLMTGYAKAHSNDDSVHTRTYTVNDLRAELRAKVEETAPITFDQEGLAVIRAETDALVGSPDLATNPNVKVYDQYINNPNADADLRLRIYEPIGKSSNFPGILWIHGGGMIISHPESDEAQNIRFADEIKCVVVSVDYRLAPENPYPAAPDDCYLALEWFHNNAESLGVDPTNIAVAGASAGGNLALSTTLRARDQHGPAIVFLMPLYPMLNNRLDSASALSSYDNRVLTSESLRYMWSYYIPDIQPQDITPYIDPIYETDWTGLPPVYTCVGEVDPLRDQTIQLAGNLMKAGIPTEYHLYNGCYHAFDAFDPEAPISKYAISECIRALKDALVSK